MQQHFVDTYYFLKWTYGYYPIKAIKYLVRYLHQNMQETCYQMLYVNEINVLLEKNVKLKNVFDI